MKATKTQNVISMSAAAFTFIGDTAESFSGPNKSGEVTTASKREVADALVAFAEATRYVKREVEETNEQGEVALVTVEVDALGEFVEAELAARLTTTRANSGASKIASLQAELAANQAKMAEMLAKLEAMGG